MKKDLQENEADKIIENLDDFELDVVLGDIESRC